MEIALVYEKRIVFRCSMEEFRVLLKKYRGNLPYKVLLETGNEEDIKRFERLGIKYDLEWYGSYE